MQCCQHLALPTGKNKTSIYTRRISFDDKAALVAARGQ